MIITHRGVADFTIGGELPGPRATVAVQLQLDYVYPLREAANFVYDPEQNVVETLNRDRAMTSLGDPFPIAFTEAEVVPCGAR